MRPASGGQMITNRNNINDLIDAVPKEYQEAVKGALDELNQNGLSGQSNPEYIMFDKYKIKVAGGDVEIIFEHDYSSGNIRIVDIKTRANIRRLYDKIRKALQPI